MGCYGFFRKYKVLKCICVYDGLKSLRFLLLTTKKKKKKKLEFTFNDVLDPSFSKTSRGHRSFTVVSVLTVTHANHNDSCRAYNTWASLRLGDTRGFGGNVFLFFSRKRIYNDRSAERDTVRARQ